MKGDKPKVGKENPSGLRKGKQLAASRSLVPAGKPVMPSTDLMTLNSMRSRTIEFGVTVAGAGTCG